MFQFTKLLSQNYNSSAKIVVNQGGTCFASSQLIATNKGSKPISQIKTGDYVKSFNGTNDLYNEVTEVKRFKPDKPIIKINLKNGSIIECTEDHLFYFKGEWVCIKQILSLLNENTSKL